jgi:hypothetical protein
VEENADVPAGTAFGAPATTIAGDEAVFVGSTRDLRSVILVSKVPLTESVKREDERLGKEERELYEWSADAPAASRLTVVSVMPNGEMGHNAHLGFENTIVRNAVSNEGTRVVWSDGRHLYMWDRATGRSVQLDVPEAKCAAGACGEGPEAATFELASADGSDVVFEDAQRLTIDAGVVQGERDLYECAIVENAGGTSCHLTDLTPSPGAGRSADVLGATVGASEDGSWVYYVANGVLGDGREHGAVAGTCRVSSGEVGEGQCNLYVSHQGVTHLVAVLNGEDSPDWADLQGTGSTLTGLTAEVSPDGRWLAFMSNRALTGYDNLDATSERPDEEVFLYHAEGNESGRILCASCNPFGARPAGREYAKLAEGLAGGVNVWAANAWIAANVPGWDSYERGFALYQPRYLSATGRVFFDSSDALASEDINHSEDVYEFEPTGVGSCKPGAPGYHEAGGGCVSLLSSGTSPEEAALLDASEGGGDVFFLTAARLTTQDVDTAADVYDAHVCSPVLPCVEEPAPPASCTNADSCRAAPSPQPGLFGSPASATFSGAESMTPAQSQPKPSPVVSSKQRLVKALAACRKKYKNSRTHRVRCERLARARYGSKKSKRVRPRVTRHGAPTIDMKGLR